MAKVGVATARKKFGRAKARKCGEMHRHSYAAKGKGKARSCPARQ